MGCAHAKPRRDERAASRDKAADATAASGGGGSDGIVVLKNVSPVTTMASPTSVQGEESPPAGKRRRSSSLPWSSTRRSSQRRVSEISLGLGTDETSSSERSGPAGAMQSDKEAEERLDAILRSIDAADIESADPEIVTQPNRVESTGALSLHPRLSREKPSPAFATSPGRLASPPPQAPAQEPVAGGDKGKRDTVTHGSLTMGRLILPDDEDEQDTSGGHGTGRGIAGRSGARSAEPTGSKARIPEPLPVTSPPPGWHSASSRDDYLRRRRTSIASVHSANSGHLRPRRETKETMEVSATRDEQGNRVINEYTISKKLGQGSFGKVKLCISAADDTAYAVKVFDRAILMKRRLGQPSLFASVEAEIAILKKLDHPNICKLYEVINDPEYHKLYLIMEYMERGSVMKGDTATMQPLEIDTCRIYLRDILAGLEYAHCQRVVHRDIKPENLLVTADDHIKISDFGVSHLFEDSKELLNSTAGTPAFLAPEALYSDPFDGKAADIWSVGITLYLFTFGKCPFAADDVFALYSKIKEQPVTWPDADFAKKDPDRADLIRRMLEKKPKKRITMEQLKKHPWVTDHGKIEPWFGPDYYGGELRVSEQEKRDAVSNPLKFNFTHAAQRLRTVASSTIGRMRSLSMTSPHARSAGDVHDAPPVGRWRRRFSITSSPTSPATRSRNSSPTGGPSPLGHRSRSATLACPSSPLGAMSSPLSDSTRSFVIPEEDSIGDDDDDDDDDDVEEEVRQLDMPRPGPGGHVFSGSGSSSDDSTDDDDDGSVEQLSDFVASDSGSVGAEDEDEDDSEGDNDDDDDSGGEWLVGRGAEDVPQVRVAAASESVCGSSDDGRHGGVFDDFDGSASGSDAEQEAPATTDDADATVRAKLASLERALSPQLSPPDSPDEPQSPGAPAA